MIMPVQSVGAFGTAVIIQHSLTVCNSKESSATEHGCLDPNNACALFDAHSRGFDNAVVCDMLGNVAELATSNIFMAKGGVVYTPAANGTFLAGITRKRVIGLLRDAGATVVETTLSYSDFQSADEIFSTGNYSKVVPVGRIDDRQLAPGPFFTKARELYMEFAHATALKPLPTRYKVCDAASVESAPDRGARFT
jgi:branched-chain amino acid aminotransferase